MTFARRIAKNTSILAGTHLLTYSISMLAFIVMSRHLKEDGLGRFNYISMVLNLFFLCTSVGMDTLLVREIARQRERTREYIGAILSLKLLLSTIMGAAYYLFVTFSSEPPEIKRAFYWAGLALWLLSSSASLQAVFVAHEKMAYRGLVLLVLNIVQLAGLVAVALLNKSLVSTVFVYHVLGAGSGLLVAIVLAWREFAPISLRPSLILWRELLGKGVSFFASEVAGRVYFGVDIIVVQKLLLNDALTGWYSVPKRLLEAVYLMTAAGTQALYPALAHRFATEGADPGRTFREIFRLILLVALPSGVYLMLCARGVIDLVYDLSDFGPSIPLLRLMGPVTALQICEGFVNYFAYVLHLEKQVRRIALFRIPLTIALYLLLIWQYEVHGAIVALALSNIYALGCCLWVIRRQVGPLGLRQSLIKPLLFSVCFGLLLWPIHNWSAFWTVPLGGIAYMFLLWALGELRRKQLEQLGLVKRK